MDSQLQETSRKYNPEGQVCIDGQRDVKVSEGCLILEGGSGAYLFPLSFYSELGS